MNSELQTRMAKHAARIIPAPQKASQTRRFSYGTPHDVRLRTALASEGLHHLVEQTLLSLEVHQAHADKLARRYLRQLAQVERSVQRQQQDFLRINKRYGTIVNPRSITAHDWFRFVTVQHGLEVLDVTRALHQIRVFKDQLRTAIEGCRGLWCLGTVEIEVVSFELMRRRADRSDSEEHKLVVCESLENRLPKRDQRMPVYFLIHFHGIVVATRPGRFTDLEKQLTREWKHDPRQVKVQPLSKVFNGKPRTPRESLLDIARYITKGGNDWINKKPSLRYKLTYEDESVETDDGSGQKTSKRNLMLQRGPKEGREDPLAMTPSEICALTTVIDGMMGMTRHRDGYLVSARSKNRARLAPGAWTLNGAIAA